MLEFTAAGISDGELWRVFSGHLIHVSWQHLWVNLAGLVFCQFLFSLPLRHLLGLSIWTSIVVSTGLLVLTNYQYYLGLSGILHAWLTAGAILTLYGASENRTRIISRAVLLLLLCKVGFELLQDPTTELASSMEQFIDSPIVTEAHWLGLVAGSVYATIYIVMLKITRISPIFGRTRT